MSRTVRRPFALAAAVALAAGIAVPTTAASARSASPSGQTASETRGPQHSFEFGVIGDVPYGDDQVARFPDMIDELSAQERDLEFVAHVGDIKAGSAECSDEYFAMIRGEFDRLALPLVLTPGDNDWTDCHRTNNGAYNPLERLNAFRDVFYPRADRTLGDSSMRMDTQDKVGLPENARFRERRVEFGVVNIQGSENSTLPWTGLGKTEPTAEQLAEVEERNAANATLIEHLFDDAERTNARGVVIMTQADMFLPAQVVDSEVVDPETVQAFRPAVQQIAERAAEFDGPVYLINGDSHRYHHDAPLAAGSPWLEAYGVDPVANLERITVEGDATSNEWTRFTVAPQHAGKGRHAEQDLLTWERVPYTF